MAHGELKDLRTRRRHLDMAIKALEALERLGTEQPENRPVLEAVTARE